MSWRRGKAYARDLRERVLAAVDGGMSACAAPPLFKVSVSCIRKVRLHRQRTGEATARSQRCHHGLALVAYHGVTRAEITAAGSVTLDWARAWLLKAYNVSASQVGTPHLYHGPSDTVLVAG